MSVARSSRSLWGWWCVASPRTGAPLVQGRQFQSSAPRPKRRSRFRNITAEKLGLLNPDRLKEYREENFPEYTKEELEALAQEYSPEQLEAIMAGEAAVNPDDLIMQGRLRDDMFRPDYVEDFTTLDPRYDIKPDTESVPEEVRWPMGSEWVDQFGARMIGLTAKKTGDQLKRSLVRALRKVKESSGEDMIDPTKEELDDMEREPELLEKFLAGQQGSKPGPGPEPEPQPGKKGKDKSGLTKDQMMKLDKAVNEEWKKELRALSKLGQGAGELLAPTNVELIEDGPAGTMRYHSAEAPELGKVPGVEGLYKLDADPEDQGQDDSGTYQEIKRLMGMSLYQVQSLYCKVLVRRNVVNQTRMGKIRSVSAAAIAGNGNGWLGLGIAKSTDMSLATTSAQMLAIRNMKPVRRYENRTIYGNVKAKVSGTVVELFARTPGYGLRCPHRIFEMCRASGLHDLAARMPRSRNPLNSVKATYEALMNQPDPEAMAIGRGRKLVDVRKVYYGGSVY